MNFKKNLAIMTITAMMTAGPLAYAQEPGTKTETRAATTQAATQEIRVKGIVEKTDKGITLAAGEKTYLLRGKTDLSSYAGKTVIITGKGYTSDAGGMVILVSQVIEMK
jgi:hypothetical protein